MLVLLSSQDRWFNKSENNWHFLSTLLLSIRIDESDNLKTILAMRKVNGAVYIFLENTSTKMFNVVLYLVCNFREIWIVSGESCTAT